LWWAKVEYVNNIIVQPHAKRGYKERADGELENRLAMKKRAGD
jgi:hypothetical protein